LANNVAVKVFVIEAIPNNVLGVGGVWSPTVPYM
jgi:hypothetical protein